MEEVPGMTNGRSSGRGDARRGVRPEAITCADVVTELRARANPENVAGMARYGIRTDGTLGVSVKDLRTLAKAIGRDHALALDLWDTGIHEARILAALVDEPAAVTEAQMERWVADLDSWDVCDQVCSNLFDRTGSFAYSKAVEWSGREELFVRRAGFVLMAALAVHDKTAADEAFAPFFAAVRRHGADQRPLVRKAASWALRQMGKRNPALHHAAVATASAIAEDGGVDTPSGVAAQSVGGVDLETRRAARWLAGDVLKELRSPVVIQRLNRRGGS
jgi:3-methyladenine DNA glycosylase AlkD